MLKHLGGIRIDLFDDDDVAHHAHSRRNLHHHEGEVAKVPHEHLRHFWAKTLPVCVKSRIGALLSV